MKANHISRWLAAIVVGTAMSAGGDWAQAQITSNQTSDVPSDSPGKKTDEPTLAQNHNRGMGASSGATTSGSEAAATTAPAKPTPADKSKKSASPVKKQIAP